MPVTRIIVRDSREQEPLPFPPYLRIANSLGLSQTVMLKVIKEALPSGDYANVSRSCLIERKSGARELWDCVCGARRRAFMGPEGQLARISQAPYAVLLVEQSYPAILSAKTIHCPNPTKMLSLLFARCAELRVAPMFVSGYATRDRTRVGEMVARILLSAENSDDQQPQQPDPQHTRRRKRA